MSFFNKSPTMRSPSKLIFDKTELKHYINKYIDRDEISENSYHLNRIFISHGNSFNFKYLTKFLSSKSVKPKRKSTTSVLLNDSGDNQLISQEEPTEGATALFRSSATIDGVTRENNLVYDEEEYVFDGILDSMTSKEFFRLLEIEPQKRVETILHHYREFSKCLDNVPIDKLDKLSNGVDVQTEVPYEIYTEEREDITSQIITNKHDYGVSAVSKEYLPGLLRTCATIVIDISRDIAGLSEGKKVFRLFKKEIVKKKGKEKVSSLSQNNRLIVVISTVMTWAGNEERRTVSENDVENRVPSPEFVDHYEFELEVLAVNKTVGLKEIMKTVVIWTGLTYGFEQDLLNFAFDAACRNKNNDAFTIPNSQNYVPVIHVENLARLLYKIISENHTPKNYCIFAVESPTNTLKQIFTALGKARSNASVLPTPVSLDTFVNKYKLEGMCKQMILVDMKVNSSINRLWPNFEWYGGKPSMINKMKSLVETYKKEHKIKNLNLLVLGPPASGKTKLARRLANHYGLMYLEPNKTVEDHINGIRKELVSLRQTSLSISDDDDDDLLDDLDDQVKVKKIDLVLEKRILELEQKLETLYSSIDANDGVLEDIHLIPLLSKQISSSIFVARGYVLDGYPTTVDQAKKLLFDDTNPFWQIDVNILPDLTISLKKKPSPPVQMNLEDTSNSLQKTTPAKKRLMFSTVTSSSSFDLEAFPLPSSSVKAAKKILKTSTKNRFSTGKQKHLIWDEKNHYNLLKVLNSHYVPMNIVTSPYSSLDFDVDNVKLPETDVKFEELINIVNKEIQLIQQHELFDTTPLKKINSITDEMNVQHQKYEMERLKEKMTLLEELEKVTDFEYIDSLSSEEYLMKYVTPTLTKLIVQVAKVRPKNPVDFLAHLALKENPEGLPELPGYSKEGVKIRKLLERMFRMRGCDENTIYSKPLIQLLSTNIAEEENEEINEEELIWHEESFE